MTDLDTLIDEQHAAAQEAENQAQTLLARIRRVPGCNGWARTRKFGECPNPFSPKHANLSVQSQIIKTDLPLASYLANLAGVGLPSREAQEERAAARQNSIDHMNGEIEKLRSRNAQVRNYHERGRMFGYRNPFTGQIY